MESGIADITHSNTVYYEENDDSIYLNMRNTNTFYKIDHKTGEIIWVLGEYGVFVIYDLQGMEKDILFYHGNTGFQMRFRISLFLVALLVHSLQ